MKHILLIFAGLIVITSANPSTTHAQPTAAQLRTALIYDQQPASTQFSTIMNKDRWLSYDKALHFTVSFLLTLASQYVFVAKFGLSEGVALPLSITSSAAAGIAKEIYDAHNRDTHTPSFRDLAADAAGILVAAGVILL